VKIKKVVAAPIAGEVQQVLEEKIKNKKSSGGADNIIPLSLKP
jgi:hypothetical protein